METAVRVETREPRRASGVRRLRLRSSRTVPTWDIPDLWRSVSECAAA
ncbi:hypothetical protein [Lysobacter gummosus]